MYELINNSIVIRVTCECGALIEHHDTISPSGMRAVMVCPDCKRILTAEPCAPGQLQVTDYEQFCKLLSLPRNSF